MYNNKGLNKTIAGLLVIAMLLVATGAYLILNAKNDTDAEKKLFLQEISSKNAMLIQTKVNDLLDRLEAISLFFSDQDSYDIEKIMPVLQRQSDMNEFKRMGIITADGKATTTDGRILDFSDREYFARAMKGESNVSGRLIDKADNLPVTVFAVPLAISDNDTVVLFGTKNTLDMAQMLTIDNFEGQGYSYIITGDGSPVIYTLNESGPQGYDNLYEAIAGDEGNSENLELLKQEIAEGKNGAMILQRDGIPRQITYNKIAINDWYIITAVSEKVISENSNTLLMRIVLVIIIILITFLCVAVMIVRHFKKNRNNLEAIAFVDEVTGYANWNRLKFDWEKLFSKPTDKKYAIMALDIGKFKVINDMFGHIEGNKLLIHLATLINLSIREGESCARVSSDNFAVLMEYSGEVRILEMLEHISRKMRDFIPGYIIEMAFGIYVIDDLTLNISAAYDRASMAKKLIKDRIDINYGFYNESVRATILNEKDIENGMKSALETGQFQVYLHPKYLVGSGVPIGAEALVRWDHPQKGLIQPDDFIPLFEKNGFIQQLDLYVFERVCAMLSRWREEKKPYAELCISINISRMHVGGQNLVQKLLDITEKYDVSPGSLEIELTESAVFNDMGKLICVMQSLKKAGFKLSIDDFGSGYSSLNTLKDLPVDIIKFDRLFMQEATNNARGKIIITCLINMAKVLMLQTVSEGVETKEQIDFLKTAGCDMAQGFFYAKPMPIADFEGLIANA